MGNIVERCCEKEPDQSPMKSSKTYSIAQVSKPEKDKSALNFSDQDFQNIFAQTDDKQFKHQTSLTADKQTIPGAAPSAIQRKKSTLHGEIVGARPKLNSITIGFSMHAHNFPITALNNTTAQKKNSMRKRSKLHSMKPPHFEILSEKLNASEEEAAQSHLEGLEMIVETDKKGDGKTPKQANLTEEDEDQEQEQDCQNIKFVKQESQDVNSIKQSQVMSLTTKQSTEVSELNKFQSQTQQQTEDNKQQ
ncbi:UNKNOWN [Stylonychia lemnae]|uniref:Uncharacterized protein n=1 Tax=Stylonychia lemnae TaxID=5949 RepID=A0A078B0S6_STYLE|nr:UNKNOWN [Stylonychia lemnae]|eukprot:CDW86718.1 UNKNOWN [Stylonychia lemnae]